MQFYGKAETAAKAILDLFKQPNTLPEALAPMFIHRSDNVPCRSWSWSNQLLTALAGTSDARGYRQWQEVGRHVKKGSRAFNILAPCKRKITETDDDGKRAERVIIFGFRSVPVFRYDDTEGRTFRARVATSASSWTLSRSWKWPNTGPCTSMLTTAGTALRSDGIGTVKRSRSASRISPRGRTSLSTRPTIGRASCKARARSIGKSSPNWAGLSYSSASASRVTRTLADAGDTSNRGPSMASFIR